MPTCLLSLHTQTRENPHHYTGAGGTEDSRDGERKMEGVKGEVEVQVSTLIVTKGQLASQWCLTDILGNTGQEYPDSSATEFTPFSHFHTKMSLFHMNT